MYHCSILFSILVCCEGLTEDELNETLNVLSNVTDWDKSELYDSTCLFDKEKIVQRVPRTTFVYLCREMKTFLNEDMITGYGLLFYFSKKHVFLSNLLYLKTERFIIKKTILSNTGSFISLFSFIIILFSIRLIYRTFFFIYFTEQSL